VEHANTDAHGDLQIVSVDVLRKTQGLEYLLRAEGRFFAASQRVRHDK
jgi:hypothetical protein